MHVHLPSGVLNLELTFKLEEFEGPLDLLLYLISKNKVNIFDIPIAEIFRQYMEVLGDTSELDMDIASDFIAMASQLMLIKSKMLLPKREDELEEDPRIQLVEMLLEYQRIKETQSYFREKIEISRDIYVKEPEVLEKSKNIEYKHSIEDLLRAAQNLLRRAQKNIPPSAEAFRKIVGREPASISSQITMILKCFLKTANIKLKNLYAFAKNKSEIIATFLAVLEMSKNNTIYIDGEGDEIQLTLLNSKEQQS